MQDYLKTVFKTIRTYGLVEEGDRIFVAISGGKDSFCCLYALKKYVEENSLDVDLRAFHISLGLKNAETIKRIVEKQCEFLDIELVVCNVKDYGIDLEELRRKNRPVCSACGVVKRYLMNKVPRELGANKVATGHHMDDFIVFFFKNFLGKNFSWIRKFTPLVKSEHPKLLTKIRPLFHVGGKENEKFFSRFNLPKASPELCPFFSLRSKLYEKTLKWYEMLYEIEKWSRGFRRQMISSIEKFVVEMKESGKENGAKQKFIECKLCGELTSSQDGVCGFCKLKRL